MFLILLFFLLPNNGFAADRCQDWFESLGIKSVDEKCVLKCSSSIVDMNSFGCPNQCEKFCRKQQKCRPSQKTRKLLKEAMVFPKDNKTIPTHKFTKREAEKTQNALEKIDPKLLRELDGVVKLSPTSPLDIGNHSQYIDKYIILYPKAFQGDLLPYIVHELGHHMHEANDPQSYKNYLKAMKWQGSERPGGFISSDSKRNPNEDFATNLEAYIMHPELLRKEVPNAFLWMKNNYKKKFELKDCNHE